MTWLGLGTPVPKKLQFIIFLSRGSIVLQWLALALTCIFIIVTVIVAAEFFGFGFGAVYFFFTALVQITQ